MHHAVVIDPTPTHQRGVRLAALLQHGDALVGTMMATAMSANVLFWIIAGQRTVVASIQAEQPVDPVHGLRGKQRSMYNTYFTLPVLFAMLSTHYSFTWSHPQNWLVLILMMLAGAAILGVIVWMKPSTPDLIADQAVNTTETALNDYQTVQKVFENRCYACHGATPQMKNVRLDSPALVKQHAQSIYQQVVVTQLMPMNNATGITDAERLKVKHWFEAGAATDSRP